METITEFFSDHIPHTIAAICILIIAARWTTYVLGRMTPKRAKETIRLVAGVTLCVAIVLVGSLAVGQFAVTG